MEHRKLLKITLLLLLIINPITSSFCQDSVTVEVEIKVYRDGIADVTYLVESDPTKAEIEVELYGKNITDIFVVNQNNLPLDFNSTTNGIKVTTLGSLALNITFSSDSYVSKIGDIWTFNFTAPATAKIILPAGANLLSTSIIPIDIQTVNSQLHILFPDDVFSVNYTLGEVGPGNGSDNGSGYDLAFYYLAGLYVVLFAIIVYVYSRLGNR